MKLEEVRKTFDRWASFYNPTHGWTLPKRHAARLALGLQPGDHVLDLACGTGLNFTHMRELVGTQGHVVGVDLSPRMLAIARQLVATHGWQNVKAREADAAQLPFPDESFHKAICSFALNIIPDYVQAIKEVRRVLVPGGRFVALEMRSGIHALPHWLQPLPYICAVELSHDTLNGLRDVFGDVQVNDYWLGTFFIATATK